MKKIVITGGHLTPALAVIEELQRRGHWEIFFFGRKFAAEGEATPSKEWEVITQQGIPFIAIDAGRWPQKPTLHSLLFLIRLPFGFFQSFYHLWRIKAKVILSFGGYVSVPVVFAGWLLKIPSLTHEQTSIKGLGTRFNSLFVKKILVSWPNTAWMFPASKVVFTGNPIRRDIFKIERKIWKRLNYPKKKPLILVTGGNQGSLVINTVLKKILKRLLKNYNVFHQVGHLDLAGGLAEFEKSRRRLPLSLRRSYHVKKYVVGKEWGTLLRQADLLISRSGANICTEVAALGKPALFIPLPWLYAEEQLKNAQMIADTGLGRFLTQDKLTPKRLLTEIEKMITHLGSYQKNKKKASRLVKLNAAKRIVDEVEKIG